MKIPSKILNRFILPIDGTLTETSTTGQSGHRSNGTEGVIHIVWYPGHSWEKVLSLCRRVLGIFYCPSRQDGIKWGGDLWSVSNSIYLLWLINVIFIDFLFVIGNTACKILITNSISGRIRPTSHIPMPPRSLSRNSKIEW